MAYLYVQQELIFKSSKVFFSFWYVSLPECMFCIDVFSISSSTFPIYIQSKKKLRESYVLNSFMPRKKKLFTKEHPEQPSKLAAIVEVLFWNHRHPRLKHEEKLAIHLSDHSFVSKNQGCCTSNCRRFEISVPKLRKWRDRGSKQYFRKERYLGKKWLMEFLQFWEKCRGIKWYKVIFPNSLLVLDAQLSYLKHDSKTHHKRSNSEEATPHQLPPPSIQFCFAFHIRRLWNAIHWWIQDLLHFKIKQGSKALEFCATCARKKTVIPLLKGATPLFKLSKVKPSSPGKDDWSIHGMDAVEFYKGLCRKKTTKQAAKFKETHFFMGI